MTYQTENSEWAAERSIEGYEPTSLMESVHSKLLEEAAINEQRIILGDFNAHHED